MNAITTKKSKKVQEVKTQMEGEHQEEVIESNPLEETKIQMNTEVQEEVVLSNTYVESLWNQYEQILDQARKFHDSSEDAYLKTVKDVIKFNKEYRKSIANIYTGTRKINREIVKGLSSNFAKNDLLNQESAQLTNQVEEVSERLEKLTVTPLKLTVDLIERLEKNVEESCEAYIHYSREGRRGLQKVSNEYVEIAKNNHKMLVNLFKESTKVLVSTNR
jgi:DNA-binding ferritin-like protein